MLIIMIFPIRITIFCVVGAKHPPCSATALVAADCHRLHHQQSVSRHGTAGIFDGLIRLENNSENLPQ
jgi:sterol desaturase/sphingolipid hydroxylase (fatty acid hydroxylase superfamily)